MERCLQALDQVLSRGGGKLAQAPGSRPGSWPGLQQREFLSRLCKLQAACPGKGLTPDHSVL